MRANEFPDLSAKKRKPTQAQKDAEMMRLHEQALAMNAKYDAHLARQYAPAVLSKAMVNCQKKQKYNSANEAATVAAVTMSGQANLALRVYLCNLCAKWHLTSKSLLGRRG